MTAETDLLPCPFCGASAAAVNMSDSMFAACSGPDCMGLLGGFDSRDELVVHWNRRACVSSATEALRAEVAAAVGDAMQARAELKEWRCSAETHKNRAERLAEALRVAMQALIPLHNAHMPDERAGLTDEDVAAAEAAFEQARAALEQENGRG
jgi:hypothetical protein